jgi:hypothetical protein
MSRAVQFLLSVLAAAKAIHRFFTFQRQDPGRSGAAH